MAISTEASRSTFTGNGVTTVFSTGFYFLDQTEVKVKLTPSGGVEVVQTLGVHYTVTMPLTVGGAGSITMLVAPPNLSSLVIERTVPFIQDTSFRTAGTFDRATHEDAMDEVVFQTQQLARRVSDLESAGAPGSVVAGNGLAFSGATLHVGAGNGIQANADDVEVVFGTLADLSVVSSDAPPLTGVEGVLNKAARIDHQHMAVTAAPATLAAGGANVHGTALTLSRADHVHAAPTAAPVNVTKAANAEGVSTSFARADHKHDITTAAAIDLTDSANAEGVAAALARSDHTHAHGARGGGTLHAEATTSTAGFMSAADKTKLDGLSAETISTGSVKTSDATPTVVLEWTPNNETAEIVTLRVIGAKIGAVDSGGYTFDVTVRRFDNVTSIIGQDAESAHETNAAWAVTVAASSPKIVVTVTGAAATSIQWKAEARRLVVAATA